MPIIGFSLPIDINIVGRSPDSIESESKVLCLKPLLIQLYVQEKSKRLENIHSRNGSAYYERNPFNFIKKLTFFVTKCELCQCFQGEAIN
jgi:hypothetical protein